MVYAFGHGHLGLTQSGATGQLVAELLALPGLLVVCLNMMDVAEQEKIHVDAAALQEALGVPVIPMTAAKALGVRRIVAWDTGVALNPLLRRGQLAIATDLIDWSRHQPDTWTSVSEHCHGTKGRADVSGSKIYDAEGKILHDFGKLGGDGHQQEHHDVFAHRDQVVHGLAAVGFGALAAQRFLRGATVVRRRYR